MVKKEIVENKWGRCLQLENDSVQLIVSLDFGPRILSYKLKDMENVFFEDPERTVFEDDPQIKAYYQDRDTWYNYGGHRLWINPEKLPETYHPDVDQVQYELTDRGAVFIQQKQVPNELQLAVEIGLAEEGTEVNLLHKVTNTGVHEKEFAIWAISPMAPGGIEVIPMGKLKDGALPNRVFSTWPYTDLTDDRLYIGKEYITLKQEPGNAEPPVNLGYNNPEAVAGYLNKGTLFLKRFDVCEEGRYSDLGVAFETFSNELFLEVESLGELKVVSPGETSVHREYWNLVKADDVFDPRNETEIEAFAEKYFKE